MSRGRRPPGSGLVAQRAWLPSVRSGSDHVMAESDAEPAWSRQHRSERFLAAVAPYARVVLVSHVNPDPDALACMLGLQDPPGTPPAG